MTKRNTSEDTSIPVSYWVLLVTMSLWLSCSSFSQTVQLVNAFPNLSVAKPLFLTHANDGTNRIAVVQQNGIIRLFRNDSTVTSATAFLNITNKLSSSDGEQGLLGLAFHPNYGANGYFYVNYTAPNPLRTVVARYSVSQNNPNRADSLSEFKILEINQPFTNHNGGMILFGTDGYLYVGMGDGGSGGDPQNNGQNLSVLLGKILRINVDAVTATTNYDIAPDNPFKGNTQGIGEEIWAWGFRNPWRFSQDPVTGQIWVGDVGQNAWEEIDLLTKGGNFGWRIMEGVHCYNPPSGCNTAGLIQPVKEYPNAGPDCSVTGGYVYRGSRRPELVGAYIYADYCSGKVWKFRYQNGQVSSDSLLIDAPFSISSFGVDQNNELYICNYSGGTIHRFSRGPLSESSDRSLNLPNTFTLKQNYPNPFNPVTRIEYSIPSRQHVRLGVHDVLGRNLVTLVDSVQEPGFKSVDFDAVNLSTGTYFYRLVAGTFVATGKMMLLR